MSNVKLSLKQLCMERFNITITRRMIDQLVRICTLYEVRDDHVEALNSPMLGVNKIHFFDKDQRAVFDAFEIDRSEFAAFAGFHAGVKVFDVAFDELIIRVVKEQVHIGLLARGKIVQTTNFIT